MSSEQPSGPDEPRRPRIRLAASAVALAVMLAGGGVAYVAAQTGGTSSDGAPAQDEDPPVLELTSYHPGLSMWAGMTLQASGELPAGGPSSAPVYRASGEVSAEAVARLAKSLGVKGEPRREGRVWRVGAAGEGQGPVLQVESAAPGAWTYAREAAQGIPAGCTNGLDGEPQKPLGKMKLNCPRPTDPTACESETVCTDSPPPVSEREAEKAAAPVLRALGYDDAEVDASEAYGTLRAVNADPVIGGLPTSGWRTHLQIGAGGRVAGASGQLAEPARGHTYPVVGAEETLRALNKARGAWASLGYAPDCASAAPHDSGAVLGEDGQVGEVQPCTPVKPRPLAVSGAEFGLSLQTASGAPVLVPSWLFAVAGHGTVAYPAVAPQYMKQGPADGTPPPGDPGTTAPSPRPSASPQPSSPEPSSPPSKVRQPVALTSYTASGSSVTVAFWGGVCSTYTASVEETSTAVRIRVTGEEKEPGKACIMLAEEFERTVRLAAPLGDRQVLDATSGKQLPRS